MTKIRCGIFTRLPIKRDIAKIWNGGARVDAREDRVVYNL